MSHKKVLVLIDWYLPGYKAGGPIQSVANIISHLKNELDFAIITANTDLHETTPYPNIKSNEWNILPDGTRVYYFSKENQNLNALKKIILAEQADVIYLNSLFSVFFTIYPLYIRKKFLPSRKTVLAPRGMLGKGALNIKPVKKKIFLLASRISGLYKNILWHASTELEAGEIKKYYGKSARVKTAVNLSAARNLTFTGREKKINEVNFVFISRISPKKNLLSTIKALQQLPNRLKITFDIYGPVDDPSYWQLCLTAINETRINSQINYLGSIENDKVVKMLSKYHFSILYTQHENFGHAIIESMAAGCPVIISDQTPWRNLEQLRCGWDVSIKDEKRLLTVLQKCCEMNQHEYDEWSKQALTFVSSVINNKDALKNNKELFA